MSMGLTAQRLTYKRCPCRSGRYTVQGFGGWDMWLRRVAVRLKAAFKATCTTEAHARVLFQADSAGFVHYARIVDVIREYIPNIQDRQVSAPRVTVARFAAVRG